MKIYDACCELLPRLYNLHHQATVENSHYYVGATLRQIIELLEIIKLREAPVKRSKP